MAEHIVRVKQAAWLARAALLSLVASMPAAEASDAAATTLRFLARDGRDASPALLVSFGGAAHRAVLDTGSTGLVMAANALPPLNTLRDLGPGRLTYSSSGRIMEGRWVETPVTIAGASTAASTGSGAGTGDAAGEVTTRPMPVLAVLRVRCLRLARDCTPTDRPRGIAMLGVGFAREADGQPQGTPDHNPFLNLRQAPWPGYVVRRDEVQVGLSEANLAGFSLVKLARDADRGDWAAAPVCIRVDAAPAACGSVLVDTGVSKMFLTVPPEAAAGHRSTLPRGTRLAFEFGGPGHGAPGYGFVVGEAATTAPSSVTLVGIGRRPTFVNTGRHLLNGFDVLFDAREGRFGYRVRPPE